MKKIISALLIVAAVLCGCQADPENVSSIPAYTGYAAKYFEYQNAESHAFLLAGEEKLLSVGDSLGGWKLERLLERGNEETQGVRAGFSCDVTLSGTFSYMQNSVYGSLLRFYPDDSSVFPRIKEDNEELKWLVVLESNDPLKQLGFSEGIAAELHTQVRVKALSVNYSPQSIVYYIEIERLD